MSLFYRNNNGDLIPIVGIRGPKGDAYVLTEDDKREIADMVEIVAVETAEVGQMLVVKSVDENGKPTEWGAIDRIGVSGTASFSEIFNSTTNKATNLYAHAEGVNTQATGHSSHAEGAQTLASGAHSHAEGMGSYAKADYAHAENDSTMALGEASHAEGRSTYADGKYAHVQGKWNERDLEGKYAHIVGNGSDNNTRSNAHTVDWDGNAWYSGDVFVGGSKQDEGERLAKVSELPKVPSGSAGQILRVGAVDENGNVTDVETVNLFDDSASEFWSEVTLVSDGDDGSLMVLEEVPDFVPGEVYTVVWNGTEYSCEAKETAIEGGVIRGVGNVGAMGYGDPTSEPFVIVRIPDSMVAIIGAYALVIPLDGSASPVLSISKSSGKIRDEYLPDDHINALIDEKLREFEGGSGGNSNQGTGLTFAQINALDCMFKVCAFNSDPYDAYTAFRNAFGLSGGTVEPDEPDIPDIPDVPSEPDEPDVPVKETYTVINNLTNCTSSNRAASVTEGSSYTATLTASEGYTLEGASVSVMVNGEDVTDIAYSNGVITVHNVLGNVVITATAVEESAGGEVVMLKSITGDGASYIDTEFILDDSTYTIEISAQFQSDDNIGSTNEVLFGASGYNVGTPYGATKLNRTPTGKGTLSGKLQGSQFTVGTWNYYEGNSLAANRFYAVIKDGSQKIYLDAEHTREQTHLSNTNTATYGTGGFVPIPLYLFTVHTTPDVHPSEESTPSNHIIYFFKITDAAGNMVLNLVPAKQGSQVGMYNTVTGKFHENKGSGTFGYEEVSA